MVQFYKEQTNDARNALVAEGRAALELDTGITPQQFDSIPTQYALEIIDGAIAEPSANCAAGMPFAWPYHTKSEPTQQIRILTDRGQIRSSDRRG